MGRDPRTLFAALGLAVSAVLASAPALAEITGTPEIIDGDTLEVQGQTFRLYGIDAPELGQTCTIQGRAYDCGKIARTALLDLTAGVAVTCRVLAAEPVAAAGAAWPGRCFAQVFDLSVCMAYTGWAMAVRQVYERYVVFEARAQAKGRGLWKGRFVSPWAWRAGARLPVEAAAE